MPVPGLDDPLQPGKVLGLLEDVDGVGELRAEADLLVSAALERQLLHPAAAGVEVHTGQLPALGALALGQANRACSKVAFDQCGGSRTREQRAVHTLEPLAASCLLEWRGRAR